MTAYLLLFFTLTTQCDKLNVSHVFFLKDMYLDS